MKSDKNKIGLELAESVLNPLSDRYRVCPNCKRPHMVRNKGRDYCSDKCADRHYNYLREYKKLGERTHQNKVSNLEVNSETDTMQDIVHKEEINSEHLLNQQKVLEKNLEVLNTLQIDPVKGSKFTLSQLINLGFDFSSYTAKAKLHNINDKYGSHYLVFGDFKIYLLDHNVALIYYNNPKNL